MCWDVNDPAHAHWPRPPDSPVTDEDLSYPEDDAAALAHLFQRLREYLGTIADQHREPDDETTGPFTPAVCVSADARYAPPKLRQEPELPADIRPTLSSTALSSQDDPEPAEGPSVAAPPTTALPTDESGGPRAVDD